LPVTLPAPELGPGCRSALVIASGAYDDGSFASLRSPAVDAEAFAAVLGHPACGGFEVKTLLDQPVQSLRVGVQRFLTARAADETIVIYVSCHGVLSSRRRLYFAARDTSVDMLAATGLESRWLIECLDECAARRQVVILDCCFSGAFGLTKGANGGPEDVGLKFLFDDASSRGREVLTASRATEYSFEGKALTPDTHSGSAFTSALVAGLQTGDADRDRDGLITVAEAYAFARARVLESGSAQTPQRWLYGGEGEVILARSPAGIAVEPAVLHDDVRAGLENRFPHIRIGALHALSLWLTDSDPARVIAARAAMEDVAAQDIAQVAAVARKYLVETPAPAALASPASDAGTEVPETGARRRLSSVPVVQGRGRHEAVSAGVVAAPLPRLGEVFFDVRGSSRSMRLSWYADTGIPAIAIWQGGTCTGTFRLPAEEIPRLAGTLNSGPHGQYQRGSGGRREQAESTGVIGGPLPRLGEVFFDVRGSSRSMRVSWYADTGVAVISIWQEFTCTGTFRFAPEDIPRLAEALTSRQGGQPPRDLADRG
jgi:hypothetical protein